MFFSLTLSRIVSVWWQQKAEETFWSVLLLPLNSLQMLYHLLVYHQDRALLLPCLGMPLGGVPQASLSCPKPYPKSVHLVSSPSLLSSWHYHLFSFLDFCKKFLMSFLLPVYPFHLVSSKKPEWFFKMPPSIPPITLRTRLSLLTPALEALASTYISNCKFSLLPPGQ